MRVAEIMQTDLVTCPPTATVVEVAAHMQRRNVGACLVTDGPRTVGIFTERDLVGLMARGEDPREWEVSRVMTREVTMAPPDADVLWVAETMRRLRVRHLPVGEDGCAVGMVSVRDLFVLAGAVLQLDPQGIATARDMLAAAGEPAAQTIPSDARASSS
jgi:CBS domain-containing protein